MQGDRGKESRSQILTTWENAESEAPLRGRRDCMDGKIVHQTKNFAQSEVWHEAKSESSGILGEDGPSGSEASC